jgi:ribonuclease T1
VFSSASSFQLKTARKLGLAISTAARFATAFGVAFALSGGVHAKGVPDSAGAVTETVRLVNLPKEARTTERLIRAGGPFPHDKDGVVFGNRERILPKHPRGYYREYTVNTSGSRNRGARRIVCGGTVAVNPDACFYSDDHYASFRRLVP